MKITPFLDLNPARDEYLGDAIGIFIGPFCLLGLFKARHAPQVGIVILNHALGIWIEEE